MDLWPISILLTLSACEVWRHCKEGETGAGISCGSAPAGCSYP